MIISSNNNLDISIMDFIRAEIEKHGPLSVDRFLDIVLYNPDFGYYFNQSVIGKDGDYVTSPEISQIFGELIALLIVEQWRGAGASKPIQVIECGPGRGTLMRDMLRVFERFPDFLQSLSIHFVEISPVLIMAQKKLLHFENLFWHKSIENVPQNEKHGFTFILANEFFDALPIKQFCKSNDGNLAERYIVLDGDQITFSPRDENIVETCPAYRAIIKNINARLYNNNGAVLIIDYGDAEKDRLGDTLQAINRHTYESIFFEPGKTDISHQVNFRVLQELLDDSLEIYPLMTQGTFLQNLGIEMRMNKLAENAKTAQMKMDILTACARLTAPNHMGSIFKVLYAVSNR